MGFSPKLACGAMMLDLGTDLGRVSMVKPEKRKELYAKNGVQGTMRKRILKKCNEVCQTYDPIQYAYADLLDKNEKIREIRCNVLLDGLTEGEYTSDFGR